MHKLKELKDRLCEELEEYSDRKVDVNSLEIIDKLSHAVKSLTYIIDCKDKDEGYSGDWPGDMRGGNRGTGGNMGGNSFARGGRGRGRNAKRDSMGRYSRAEDETIEELREIMGEIDDDRIRRDIREIIERLERM